MQKIFSKNFVKSVFVKKSVQFLQIAKTFIIFFGIFVKKIKEILEYLEKFL